MAISSIEGIFATPPESIDHTPYLLAVTRTPVAVDEEGKPVPIDIGFIVFHEVTNPSLADLFAELRADSSAGGRRGAGLALCATS
ncbi:MAG: hypothetical protein ABI837_02205 [Acidobacteriota bacterium]